MMRSDKDVLARFLQVAGRALRVFLRELSPRKLVFGSFRCFCVDVVVVVRSRTPCSTFLDRRPAKGKDNDRSHSPQVNLPAYIASTQSSQDHSVHQTTGGTRGLSQPPTAPPRAAGDSIHRAALDFIRPDSSASGPSPAAPSYEVDWDRNNRHQNYLNPARSYGTNKNTSTYRGNKREVIHSIGGGADRAKLAPIMEQAEQEGTWARGKMEAELTTRKVYTSSR